MLAGLALAAAVAWSWHTPPAGGALGLDLRLVAVATGDVALEPPGALAAERGMAPGSSRRVSAEATLTNQTGRTLDVRIRALPADRDLDRILALSVRIDGRPAFRGRLGELRAGTSPVRLAPAQRVRVAFRAWLPRSVEDGHEGRMADLPLEAVAR